MLNFDNTKIAFQNKSNSDLNRAYILFKTISHPIISKILKQIIKASIWLRIPIDSMIKATVYKQFCGGTTIEDTQSTINQLWSFNFNKLSIS